MDNSGSKSIIQNSMIVKEQRADGDWNIKPDFMNLRCNLKGFERNININSVSTYYNVETSISKSHLSNTIKKFFLLVIFLE